MAGEPTSRFYWGQSTVTVAQGETVTITSTATYANLLSYSVGNTSIATATHNSTWTSWTIQGVSPGTTTVNVTAENAPSPLTITVTAGDDQNFLNERGLTHFWENIDSVKQDKLTAGDHINISNNIIKAVDYVHSDNPVPSSQVTQSVTNDMIATGTITADKFATGEVLKLTLSTSDIGEGSPLASNTLYGVYK